MSLVGSVAVVALGAILLWGVNGSVGGINVNTIGAILMVLGCIGVVLSLVVGSIRRDSSDQTVEDERPVSWR